MKIKLSKKNILKNIETDDELMEMNIKESIYIIRKLKALTESLTEGCIKVKEKGKHQFYSKKYNIFFSNDEVKSYKKQ